MIDVLFKHYALAFAVASFVPGYLAGARLRHPHAPLLVGAVGAIVVYLAATALAALAVYVALPLLAVALYFRFNNDIRQWGQSFAAQSGVRVRHWRRSSHVNEAIDRLLNRKEVVAHELDQLKQSGVHNRHADQRLREELQSIERTLEDLL